MQNNSLAWDMLTLLCYSRTEDGLKKLKHEQYVNIKNPQLMSYMSSTVWLDNLLLLILKNSLIFSGCCINIQFNCQWKWMLIYQRTSGENTTVTAAGLFFGFILHARHNGENPSSDHTTLFYCSKFCVSYSRLCSSAVFVETITEVLNQLWLFDTITLWSSSTIL